MGLNEFLPSNKLIKFLSYYCENLGSDTDICENIIFSICGFDRTEFDEVRNYSALGDFVNRILL